MKFTIAWRAGLAGLVLAAGGAGGAPAQPAGTSPLTPPANGMKRADPTWHALTNATVHVNPSQTIEKATVVVRDGRIVSVGGGEPPAGARVWDCTGLHIYAGFIDAYVEVDAPAPAGGSAGTHWNSRVTPQRSALDGAGIDERTAESLRKLGFAAAVVTPRGGVFRGSSATISLAKPEADASADRPPVYSPCVYQSVAFETGGFGGGDAYPSSQMGAIALVRQTLIDEAWQRSARDAGEAIPENALDALAQWRGADGLPSAEAHAAEGASAPPQVPLLFDARDELEVLRAIKVAGEFSRPLVILGSGSEFKRLAAIEAAGKPGFILPLNFPKAPDVASVGKAEAVTLEELMTWEQAPTNPRRLRQAGVHVALTTARLRDKGDFDDNLRKAIRHGLKPADALAGLTTVPAMFANVKDLGAVAEGMRANLVVADGDLFAVPEPDAKPQGDAKPEGDAKPDGDAEAEKKEGDEKADAKKDAKVRDVWIDGVRHEINAAPDHAAVGLWKVTEADGQPIDPDAATTPRIIIDDKNTVTVQVGDKKVKATNVRILRGRIDYVYDLKDHGGEGLVADQATVEGKTMIGITRMADGTIHRWKAVHAGDPPKEARAPRGAGGGERAGAPGMPGRWKITTIDGKPAGEREAVISIKDDRSVAVSARGGEARLKEAKVEGDEVSYILDTSEVTGDASEVKVSGKREGDKLAGSMMIPGGATLAWEAERQPADPPARPDAPKSDAAEPKPDPIKEIPEKIGYPFGPYMMDEVPPQEGVLVTNATIWTSGPQGVIKDGAIVVSGGKIVYVGPAASLPRLDGSHRTVDAAGKHVTPGLIDCHSHTGISGGVNEGSQACTSEVRIGDVTDPDAINWYRQLAGGITAVNNLHGSANPIGGQNQVNKVRWGVVSPDDMHFEGAIPGIKFALGENVKRSRSTSNTRYPDTRMGVESFIRDRFTAAREYAAARKGENPPRRDLELDCLAEILAGQRLVHCHSYRQDEILMLARLSAEFGFKLGTYQHGLECYKVADAVRESSRGASIFSDWWAYKVEVQDAIPQAGAILHEQGVVVSFNSDSDELARRMNVEAAKAVKYGGLRPEEALKFVTINPAIQLDVASRVGSLEEGKDADFAIWSGDPLSSLSRCEATFVDGREYFSLARDADHRTRIAAERQRLMQKVLTDGKKPAGGTALQSSDPRAEPPSGRRRPPTEADAIREYYLSKLRRGLDADAHVCGECGLGIDHAVQGGAR